MHCHANAAPDATGSGQGLRGGRGRHDRDRGLPGRAGISRRFYYRWLPRWRAERHGGLVDRSSRPRSSPQRLSLAAEAASSRSAPADRLGTRPPGRLAGHAGVDLPPGAPPPGPRGQSDRAPMPVVRYEHERARRPAPPRHQEAGPHRGRSGPPGHRRSHAAGAGASAGRSSTSPSTTPAAWSTRSCCPTSGRTTAARFSVRALRWFRAAGRGGPAGAHRQRPAYAAGLFGRVLRRLGLKHTRTRPYRPQTNGKVERWIRTVLSECLYLEVFASSDERALALDRFIRYYNEVRPHLGIGGRTPRQRLEREARGLTV